MKFCIVTHKVEKGDGQGRVNYEVVLEALNRGHKVTAIANQVAEFLLTYKRFSWVPVTVDKFPSELLRNLRFADLSAKWIRKNRHQFDLLQVNGAITWEAGDINAAHFVHSAWLRSPAHTWKHRKDFYGFYQWFYTALNARWEYRAFSQAKKVIAVSSQVRDDLQAIDICPDRIQIVYNGVDTNEFYPGTANRITLGLPKAVPLAIFAGDIRSSRKNLDSVLKALVLVPDLHLAVIGKINNSPYPALSNKLGIKHRVHFLGYRHDIPELMRASDFLVFPSRYETFGLVILEAMASGIPVITSETTPAAELLIPDAGIVISNPDDISTLAREMYYLVQNPERRRQMGIQAHMIAKNHSWGEMAQRYVDLFEKLT